MSRGLGRIQRAILRLIAQAKPDAGWSVEQLCQKIYGGSTPTQAQLGSVTRALKMKLPGSWRTGRTWGRDHTLFLYDRSNADWKAMIEPFELVELVEIEMRG